MRCRRPTSICSASPTDRLRTSTIGTELDASIPIPPGSPRTRATQGWRSETIHRGTTKNNPEFHGASRIDDGDSTTFWWSNPGHPDAPGWFLFDLVAPRSIDSVRLHLGDLRPDSVRLVRWTGPDGVYPPPDQQATGWVPVATIAATSLTTLKFPAISSRYSGFQPVGPLSGGWKVAEAGLWSGSASVTTASTDPGLQTLEVATSTHPASRRAGSVPNWEFDAYMAWIRNYPGAIPMVSVNYGTGTVQEAASWVRYANVTRKYGIGRWQVGNENSGAWEEGGAVSARQYATRYVQFAKAMKAVDPTIQVSGPLTPESDWLRDASGDFDGRSWLEGFLVHVDSAERADNFRYLDGVDVHTYPYYYENASSATAMLAACDREGTRFDSLAALVNRTLHTDPEKREIINSEFNAMVGIRSSLQEDVPGASAAGLVFAHYIQRFGNRGAGVFWQRIENGSLGTDGTYGSMGAINPAIPGSSTTYGYAPNSTFWMLRTQLREWLDTNGTDTIPESVHPRDREEARIPGQLLGVGLDHRDGNPPGQGVLARRRPRGRPATRRRRLGRDIRILDRPDPVPAAGGRHPHPVFRHTGLQRRFGA